MDIEVIDRDQHYLLQMKLDLNIFSKVFNLFIIH